MLAKFQGMVLRAQKIADMPGYNLYKSKKFIGSIFLDTNVFLICANPFEKDNVLSFQIDPSTFQILNYDIIDAEWLSKIIEDKILSIKDIANVLDTAESTVYRWKSGETPIPGQVKPGLFSLVN